MTVSEVLEKIKSIDRDIESINWAKEQINIRPNDADFSYCAWEVLEEELKKLEEEKSVIMNYYVKDYNAKTIWEGGEK